MLPHDSNLTAPKELSRLAGQNQRTLARLEQGPATARELSEISLKYTGRISDLRAAGYDIQCEDDPGSGRSRYVLVQVEQPRQGHDVNAMVPQGGRLW